MCRSRSYANVGTLIWLALTSTAALAQPPEPPPVNILRGVVVSKLDGQPLAHVPVVMVHGEKGYLTVGSGGIDGAGEAHADSRSYVSRNSRVVCDAITGSDGSFVLRSFTAPTEPWILAAGNREHGLYLRTAVVPAEFHETPLRIEVAAPAFITTKRLPDPPEASFRARVELAITELNGRPPAPGSVDHATHTPDAHVRIYAWPEQPDEAVWQLGPLPPDYTYRVTHSLWSPSLRFDITLFERRIFLRPGATEMVLLEAESGATLSGRITDSQGQPLTYVNVRVRTRGESGIVLGALSDTDGRYTIRNVPAGTHTLELLRHARPTAPT